MHRIWVRSFHWKITELRNPFDRFHVVEERGLRSLYRRRRPKALSRRESNICIPAQNSSSKLPRLMLFAAIAVWRVSTYHEVGGTCRNSLSTICVQTRLFKDKRPKNCHLHYIRVLLHSREKTFLSEHDKLSVLCAYNHTIRSPVAA